MAATPWVFARADGDVTAWAAADRDSAHLGAGEYHALFSTAGDRVLVQGEYYGGEADAGERVVAYAVERAEQKRVFERRRDKKLGGITAVSYTPAADRFAFVARSDKTARLGYEVAGAKATTVLLETTDTAADGQPATGLSGTTVLAGDEVLFVLGGKLTAIHTSTKAQRSFEAGSPRVYVPARKAVTIAKYHRRDGGAARRSRERQGHEPRRRGLRPVRRVGGRPLPALRTPGQGRAAGRGARPRDRPRAHGGCPGPRRGRRLRDARPLNLR